MKKVLFLFVFSSLANFAQESAPTIELFFGTESASGYDPITFTLTKVSIIWGQDYPHSSCENYNQNEFWIDTGDLYATGSATVSVHNLSNFTVGLDFVGSRDNNGVYDTFGFGLYKITNSESNSNFYLDYRDPYFGCVDFGYDNVPPNGTGHHCDLWIKYNPAANSFSYSNNKSSYNAISNQELLQIWTIKGANTPNTLLFDGDDNFWTNSLAIVPSGNNHPLLVWGHYPVDEEIPEIFHYSIDRKNGGLDWEYDIAQTSAAECVFEDEDFTMPVSSSHTVYYRVRAVRSESPTVLYTGYTNAASILVSGYDPGKNNIYNAPILTFNLDQNYPNPFNPATRISYSIRKPCNVKLEVYDIYGSRVATLVEGIQDAGEHSFDFDGSRLSSGLYIYRIQAGEYTASRKMTLIK